jgi:hypothetical protein
VNLSSLQHPLNILIVVLDPRVTYRGLLRKYANNPRLLADIESSKQHFKRYFIAQYASSRAAAHHAAACAASTDDDDDDIYGGYAEDSQPISSPEAELDDLFALRALPVKGPNPCPDAIQWWAVHCSHFPLLSRMARDILSIPGVPDLVSATSHALTIPIYRFCCFCGACVQRRS